MSTLVTTEDHVNLVQNSRHRSFIKSNPLRVLRLSKKFRRKAKNENKKKQPRPSSSYKKRQMFLATQMRIIEYYSSSAEVYKMMLNDASSRVVNFHYNRINLNSLFESIIQKIDSSFLDLESKACLRLTGMTRLMITSLHKKKKIPREELVRAESTWLLYLKLARLVGTGIHDTEIIFSEDEISQNSNSTIISMLQSIEIAFRRRVAEPNGSPPSSEFILSSARFVAMIFLNLREEYGKLQILNKFDKNADENIDMNILFFTKLSCLFKAFRSILSSHFCVSLTNLKKESVQNSKSAFHKQYDSTGSLNAQKCPSMSSTSMSPIVISWSWDDISCTSEKLISEMLYWVHVCTVTRKFSYLMSYEYVDKSLSGRQKCRRYSSRHHPLIQPLVSMGSELIANVLYVSQCFILLSCDPIQPVVSTDFGGDEMSSKKIEVPIYLNEVLDLADMSLYLAYCSIEKYSFIFGTDGVLSNAFGDMKVLDAVEEEILQALNVTSACISVGWVTQDVINIFNCLPSILASYKFSHSLLTALLQVQSTAALFYLTEIDSRSLDRRLLPRTFLDFISSEDESESDDDDSDSDSSASSLSDVIEMRKRDPMLIIDASLTTSGSSESEVVWDEELEEKKRLKNNRRRDALNVFSGAAAGLMVPRDHLVHILKGAIPTILLNMWTHRITPTIQCLSMSLIRCIFRPPFMCSQDIDQLIAPGEDDDEDEDLETDYLSTVSENDIDTCLHVSNFKKEATKHQHVSLHESDIGIGNHRAIAPTSVNAGSRPSSRE